MKTLLISISLGLFAANAEARGPSFQYIFEKEMPLAACESEMQRVATEWKLTLQQWQENDYYLLREGEHAGNAYYSAGTCYIYIH